jgi:ankyrin repeat protein
MIWNRTVMTQRPTARLAPLAALLLTLAAPAVHADLMDAVRSNDTQQALVELANPDTNVNMRMGDGTTPLHWAVYHGNLDLVEELIDYGADVNARNEYGSTPMSEAGVRGDYEILRLLLDADADVESPSLEGQTVLMSVVRTPHVDAAELLLNKGANPNAAERWRGQTALMFAAAQSQPAMVRLLLRRGAHPNTVSKLEDWPRQVTNEPRPQSRPLGGYTALLLAAREGCARCARYLIEGGADINQVDPNGITPLLMATLNARWDVAKVLIEAGADVNRWDTWGRAPLYSTVDYNTVPRGGRPDRPSLDDTTPVEVARLLLEKGANPDMQLKIFPPYRSLGNDRGGDSMLTVGTTPLIRAAKAGDVEMVQLLLKSSALADLKNQPGYTPLMASSGLGSTALDLRAKFRDEKRGIETAKMLLEAGANINARDEQGRTALNGAVQWDWPEWVKWAVANGADINSEDNRGFTVLDHALGRVSAGGRFNVEINEKMAELLVSLGARAGSGTLTETGSQP